MRSVVYRERRSSATRRKRRRGYLVFLCLFLLAAGAAVYWLLKPTPAEQAIEQLSFDATVTPSEQQTVRQAISQQIVSYEGTATGSVVTSLEVTSPSLVLDVLVPVTGFGSPLQGVTSETLADIPLFVSPELDDTTRSALAQAIGVNETKLTAFSKGIEELDEAVAFVPISQLTYKEKLLRFNDAYYLDDFSKGAIFRQASFSGSGAASLAGLKLNELATNDSTLKVNVTGVTALTRLMIRKLGSANDATYFSEKIGDYLADADITHVSNEVSFKEGCQFHNAVFCSPPGMIDALKDSGVDLVELTGNHNNDTGRQYNTETINLYHELGWSTVGGGLNKTEAAKPFIADQKNSKVAFLAYNYPDSPNGGAIATDSAAGANDFDFDRIKADIEALKAQADFIIVNVQFWECYAYPEGYVEFPQCDGPIPNQKEVFRKIADLGANMVIGTSAHQPQTYELYNGIPIYYGLGNLYFEQVQWPGTERGIILTHYFINGKHVQTKLSPTVYDRDLQTRLMDDEEAVNLLERLGKAR